MTAMLDPTTQRALIDLMATTITGRADELTDLDRAIGDADHGINMRRGFEHVRTQIDAIASKPTPEALKALGTALMMKVGGASGPLYGTLFMTLGKAWPANLDGPGLAHAVGEAIAAIKRLGKSDLGQKTLLDVLAPVQQELATAGDDLPARVARAAHAAAQATKPLRAIRGRASFLGDRSIGHVDPGARSLSLLIVALCRFASPGLDPDLENHT